MKRKNIIILMILAVFFLTPQSIFSASISENETGIALESEEESVLLGTDRDILTFDQYEYAILEDETIVILKYLGNESVVKFPNKINGKYVTRIGGGNEAVINQFNYIHLDDNNPGYMSCDSVSVIIPDSVRHVGAKAFYYVQNLTDVTISEGVESIGEYAFCWDDKMKSIKLPRSLKSIERGAFSENWISDIYYAGTKAEWERIQGEGKHPYSEILGLNFTIHCLDGNITKYIPEGPETWRDKEGIEGFVYRLYNVALLRDAEEAGLADWMNRLQTGEENAAEVARGIFFSEEFLQKNYTDEQYVEFLYRTLFGRKSDIAGKENWLNCLENGVSREYVYHGFAESEEFTGLCDNFGVSRGKVALEQYRDINMEATGFIARLYTKILGRKFDEDGLENWCKAYITKEKTIEDIAAEGFLHSPELEQQNLNNKEFVTRMYETFLNREPDEDGLNDWVEKLERGIETRNSLVYGFTNSPEFAKLKAEYNLP